MSTIRDVLNPPKREYFIFSLVIIGFAVDILFPRYQSVLFTVALFGAYPVFLAALMAAFKRKLTIEVFNAFALLTTFVTGDMRSAAFIVLMLAFARLLEWRTETKTSNAVEDLLKQKPKDAVRESGGVIQTIPIERIRVGDIIIVKSGEQIPVDGIIVFGKTEVNEAIVTGESLPVEKIIGDEVLISTMNVSQPIKIRATRVGRDSTIEKIAQLIRVAEKNKSKEQRFADVFAGYFFPVILALGLGTYLVTRSVTMVVALFLVACADDIAVAIPLAVTAALGHAAKHGVIIKGGNVLRTIAKAKTLILDKTGTLTYGDFVIKDIFIDDGISKEDFWQAIAIAEKYSEHPIGKVLFKESLNRTSVVPNAQKYQIYKSAGVWARFGKDDIIVGNEDILKQYKISFPRGFQKKLVEKYRDTPQSIIYVAVNAIFVGYLTIADTPRAGAKESISKMKTLGIEQIVILTGDKEASTKYVAKELDIPEYHFNLKPEDKLVYIEKFAKEGPVIMIGDGVNDAPGLARADVGIAMGKGGSAIAAETADVVMLHDNLSELPGIIELGRRSSHVVYWDMGLWFVSNILGFVLVFLGLTPALAAFYNFATDFIPILNSTRLFADRKVKDVL